ncbi:MAG: hypothetical protein ACRDCW_18215 [Sarcina sp.]
MKKLKERINSILSNKIVLRKRVLDETIIKHKRVYNSYFDKKVDQYIWFQIKMKILGVVTLGLAYPWILCSQQKSKCQNMVICGRRLKFIGNPKDLIGHWILWWFLSAITLGIYLLVVKVRFQQWVTANIIFDDVPVESDIINEKSN